jgi:hypothetical protein
MCISERVSWITLIIGTVSNILSLIYLSQVRDQKVVIPIILILLWQYALLMQIPDALAWRNPSATYPGKMAFILNTTQPMILFVVVATALFKMGVSLIRLIPAILTLTAYIILTIKEALHRKNYDINPTETCKHLTYPWWGNARCRYFLYMASIILLIFSLAPAWGYIIFTLVIFIGSLIASTAVSGHECSGGSLWCWSIAGAGAATIIYFMISRKNFTKR